jgi:hypothetical protein
MKSKTQRAEVTRLRKHAQDVASLAGLLGKRPPRRRGYEGSDAQKPPGLPQTARYQGSTERYCQDAVERRARGRAHTPD